MLDVAFVQSEGNLVFVGADVLFAEVDQGLHFGLVGVAARQLLDRHFLVELALVVEEAGLAEEAGGEFLPKRKRNVCK